MKENKNFAKLNPDGSLTCAPRILVSNGRVLVSPSEAAYRAAGWLPVTRPDPNPPDGQRVAATRYEVADGAISTVYDYAAAEPTPRLFSKLKLYAALSAANLWQPLVDWLETQTVNGLNARTAFDLAQDLSDTHPLFTQMLDAAKSALGVTDEQVAQILAASEADA